ncbi:alpha beta hydrolase fold [Fusarium pseudoanthophilum]|uniref:Alpha beta hydrolase fold n=1 Tax=Fusarium pseudoanthophilum TaxID=48495 RepID=A0A8H5V4N4_9HYPO|nr:alpha beta hydrolase fold [Fusarium pseudoanthophilum]
MWGNKLQDSFSMRQLPPSRAEEGFVFVSLDPQWLILNRYADGIYLAKALQVHNSFVYTFGPVNSRETTTVETKIPSGDEVNNCPNTVSFREAGPWSEDTSSFIVPGTIVSILLRGLPFAIKHKVPLNLWFSCMVGRILLGNFNPREIQYLSTPTTDGYTAWIKKQRDQGHSRLDIDIEPLTDTDASILWIGNRKKASKFVLFLHGGGYVSPPLPGHFTWCWEAYVNGGPGPGKDVAVAFLQYTLAPGGKYPDQLRQASAALNHLLQSGVSPRDMIVGGDSAGGNLTAQLAYHLLHPNPAVPELKLQSPLAGMFLVSPWLSDRTDTASFKDYGNVDMLSAGLLQHTSIHSFSSEDLKPKFNEAHLALPMDGDLSWLSDLPSITKALYITVGGCEVFCDAVVEFGKAAQEKCRSIPVLLEVGERECHDFILIENQAEVIGDATERMRNWASGVLVD